MALLIPQVVSQHAEEAAILWLRRDWAVAQPHFSLADLTKLDDQLDAHLDGLRIAGEPGWETAEHELRWGDPGEVFAAAILAFETGLSRRVHRVIEDARGPSYAHARPLVAALAWMPWKAVHGYSGQFVADASPLLRRIGIAAAVAHRRDPGPPLPAAMQDADPMLRARALRAAGELGRVDLLPLAREHLTDGARACRFAAAWSVALFADDAEAVATLRDEVESGEDGAARALQLGLRRMAIAHGREWISRLAGQPGLMPQAVLGAGVLGLPELVPWLTEMMRQPDVARVAGEAFSMITRVHVAYNGLEADWPEGFTAGPTEDSEDENVVTDPDENLPWPDAEKVAAWWTKHRGRFQPGTRYLLGRPITEEWPEEVLRHGYQRQRAAAALELAIRRPGQPLFEVRAPGFRQQQLLGLKSPER
jgi:uncharacterized protein (TIGR02270 family)